jgi:hypothetical protein
MDERIFGDEEASRYSWKEDEMMMRFLNRDFTIE